MKKLFITMILFSFLSPVANASEAEIDIQEESSIRAAKIFDAIDVDSDGFLSRDEFINFHSKLVERRIEKFMPNKVEIDIEDDTFDENTDEVSEVSEVSNDSSEIIETVETIETIEENTETMPEKNSSSTINIEETK